MGPKRHLGLGKAAKAKKLKTNEESSDPEPRDTKNSSSNELTVELAEEAGADDELGQLQALWKTHCESDKENSLIVNGIIHECDRLLRNWNLKQEGIELPDYFHSIYALALADLAFFHAEDKTKVKEAFDAALERIELGQENHLKSEVLGLTQARVLLGRLPLQYISQMTVDSKVEKECPSLAELLDESLEAFEIAETRALEAENHQFFNHQVLEYLDTLDNLLQLVDDFGQEKAEGDESDDEEEEIEEEQVELPKTHPLYSIKSDDKYNQWWRVHTQILFDEINHELERLQVTVEIGDGAQKKSKSENQDSEHKLLPLRREVSKRLGQSYLQEAEEPSNIHTSLMYDDELADVEEIHGLTRQASRDICIKLLGQALTYLTQAQDKDSPESWVSVAEAMISLGNMHELDSPEQEEFYNKAEAILVRANNVTNGRFELVLVNLRGED